jgi:hypothetical protein
MDPSIVEASRFGHDEAYPSLSDDEEVPGGKMNALFLLMAQYGG